MTYDEISNLIADESKDIVYLSDPETYKLRYLNRAAQEILGFPKEEEWLEKPCYQLLQNLDSPCPFCTNHLLSADRFYVWSHYNEAQDKYFTVKDKFISLNGKQMRLELAIDITEMKRQEMELRQKLLEEKTLVACIETLNRNMETDKAIDRLLQIVGGFYKADRAYIFEINYEKDRMNNTYEWCKEGTRSQIGNLKNLPLSALGRWLEQFQKKGEFFITALGKELDEDTMEFQILDAQGINSLMAAPLINDNEIVGFLGVDNPSENTERMELLRSVSTFIINDINKNKLMERLTDLSYTDALTGLDNRNRYMRMLESLEEQPPQVIGILFLDINGLKQANDTYGHQYGDHLICHAGDVLLKIFGNHVYRLGGDEFVVLCPEIKKNDFNDKVLRLRKQSQCDEELKVSIGASWHSDCSDIKQRITHVDDLMYIDKQKYYGMRLESMGNYHAGLSRQLMREIAEGKFEVYLQPKIDLKTEKIAGAEALVRRRDERGRKEAPDKFIPVYEAEGIIRHIDFFVLSKVCETLKKWIKDGKSIIRIAVNVSRVTLLEHDITEKLLEVCYNYEVKPEWINIEVTESIGTMEEHELRELLERLKEAGFTISLDDFGSEYSNLAILTSMDFNEIKLDKSLINHLESNQRSRVVTEHTIKMCQDLELMLSVAEGIETSEQKELLQGYDCAVGQGFLFDKPMPIDSFTRKYVDLEA